MKKLLRQIKGHPLVMSFNAIRKEIRSTFYVAVVSLLFIELWFKHIPAPFKLFYTIGEIYLKLCYSLVSATIFYFLNQQLPREEKKIRFYRFINNKVYFIMHEIAYVLSNLKVEDSSNSYNNVTQEMINKACERINPMTPVVNGLESAKPFDNWYEYLNYKKIVIKNVINDLLSLNDSIDTDLLEMLLIMDDIMFNFLNFENKKWANKDLTNWAHAIYKLKVACDKACEIKSVKYNKYGKESNNRFRKHGI